MHISYSLNRLQSIAGKNRWLVVIFAPLFLVSLGMVSHDAFATSQQSSWCSLYRMDLGEISDDSFLAYLHFCTKQTPSTSNPTQHNFVHKQSSMPTNSPNAQASIQTSTPSIVQINNDPVTLNGTKRTESEISIAVSGSNIVAGYNDDQDTNTATYSGYSYSNDGGKTWTDGGGILPNPGDFNANDPSVVADSQGNFYRSMDVENATHSKWGVAKSTDGGKTFGNPVIVDSVNASTPAFLDKGYMGVGPNPTNPLQNIIHVTYTKFTTSAAEVIYKRSLDGGLTWQDSCTLNPGGDAIGAMPIADQTGNTVYVFYQDFISSKIVGWKNTNAGAGCHWIRLADVGVVHPLIAHKVCGGMFAVWNGNHRATEIPVEAIGPNGNLYVTWNDSPDGGNTTQIVLFRSQDGGATWVGPQTFSVTPGRDQFEPWIAVAPNGKITIIFYDRVNDPNNLKMDLYATSSTDNGTTWQSNQRITPSSFSWGTLDPPSDPFFFPCYFIGDYQSITYDSNNIAHVAWSDGSVIASDGTPKPNVFYTQLITTSVPSAPQNLQASSGNAQVSLSWTAPSSSGGSAITGYEIERSTDGGITWSAIVSNTANTQTTYTDTRLTASTTYTYRVSAINSVGTSSPSNVSSATTSSAQVSIMVKSVDLSGNPINGMSVVIRYTNGTTISDTFTPASFTVASGTTYVVHVRDYQTNVFNHWQDGSTNSYYTITPTQNVVLTAYYSTSGPAPTVPSAPQNLQATGGNTQISLSWTAPSSNGGSAITNYKIYRSTSSGTETLLATTGNVVSYTDDTVTNGQTYFYKVTAVNSVGESLQSNEASATSASSSTAPQPPTGLTATAVSSSRINLSWTAPSNNGGSAITGYKIERSTDGGTTWSTIVANTATTSTTYSDTGLTASTAYAYRVSAINSVGTSSPSSTASATTQSSTCSTCQLTVSSQLTTGDPLTGMFSSLSNQNNQIVESGFTPITFNLTNAAQYTVGIGSFGTYTFDHWQDTGSTTNPRPISVSSNSAITAIYQDSAVTLSPSRGSVGITVSVTGAPSTMTFTTFSPNHTITLTWDGTTLATTPSTIISNSSGGFSATFKVPTSANGSHKVTATDGTNTHSALFTVDASNTAPQPPTGLTATAVSSSQINLSWTAPSNNGGSAITGYKIERSADGGTTWSAIVSNTGNTATTYSDTGLTHSTTYTYRVSAINQIGTSPPSNTSSATTFNTVPSQPVNLTATAQTLQINLSWNAPSDNGGIPITGYKIERSTDNGSTWSTLVANTGSAGTTYSDTNVLPLTTYTYRVSAINNIGTGNTSNTASVSITGIP